jgi:beta-galactosidase
MALTTDLDRYEWSEKDGSILLTIESHTSNPDKSTSFENRIVYTVSGSGKMVMDHTVTPVGKMPEWLPRVGVQMVLDSTFSRIHWFGRGPFETYTDRKTGAKIGIYSGFISEQYVPYLIPQENSNKTDVRWVKLEKSDGTGIRISAPEPFSCSALPYQSDNLSRALYPFQLKSFDGVTMNLDYALSGVGCTAISVLDKYRVYPSERQFRLVFEPYAGK